jgi:hypothetical protein
MMANFGQQRMRPFLTVLPRTVSDFARASCNSMRCTSSAVRHALASSTTSSGSNSNAGTTDRHNARPAAPKPDGSDGAVLIRPKTYATQCAQSGRHSHVSEAGSLVTSATPAPLLGRVFEGGLDDLASAVHL